jgi:hypothetical protein
LVSFGGMAVLHLDAFGRMAGLALGRLCVTCERSRSSVAPMVNRNCSLATRTFCADDQDKLEPINLLSKIAVIPIYMC